VNAFFGYAMVVVVVVVVETKEGGAARLLVTLREQDVAPLSIVDTSFVGRDMAHGNGVVVVVVVVDGESGSFQCVVWVT
jgi:hypothetical protein